MKKIGAISLSIALFFNIVFGNQSTHYNDDTFSQSNALEGFLVGTLIKTEHCYIPIEQLKVGDFVSRAHGVQEILNIKQVKTDQTIQLNINGALVCVAENQQFYLYDHTLKKASALFVGDCLLNGNVINDKTYINETVVCCCLSTEEQSFFVYPNISVHNFDMVTIGTGGASVLIGAIELLNPIILIGGIIGLSWYALQFFRSNACFYEIGEKEYTLSEEDLSFASDTVIKETRKYYDDKKTELCKLRKDLIELKNRLLFFLKPSYKNVLCFSIGLLSEYQYNFINVQTPNISYDLRLNIIDRAKLIKIRESELKTLEQENLDISMLLCMHLNEIIERKKQANIYLDDIEVKINQSIDRWNSCLTNMQVDVAIDDYLNHFIWNEMIKALELKTKELDLIITYYKANKTHFFVKQITNIDAILEERLQLNRSTFDYIKNAKNIICSNMQHHEFFLGHKGLLSQELINQNRSIAKKYVLSKDTATVAHFKKKKEIAKNEVNQKFKADSDKKSDNGGGSDKDPKDDDPLPVNNLSILMHIFRDKEGHLLDTPENRELLRNLVRDIKNYIGKDARYQREWYAKITKDGKQIWAWMRGGMIRDGGLNNKQLFWNSETGFCSPIIPRG